MPYKRNDNADNAPRPSAKQIYCMAHMLCDIAGIDWPSDRAEASAIIQRLAEQRETVVAVAAGNVDPDTVPF